MVGSLNRTPARMFMTKQVLSVLRLLQSLFEAECVHSVGVFFALLLFWVLFGWFKIILESRIKR